jgi:hypothetical protein
MIYGVLETTVPEIPHAYVVALQNSLGIPPLVHSTNHPIESIGRNRVPDEVLFLKS